MERRTTLEVTGFNRQALVRRLDEVFNKISIKKNELQKLNPRILFLPPATSSHKTVLI
jgi:hypothetical protein